MNHSRAFFLSAFLALTLGLILFKPIFAQPEKFDALDLINEVNALRAKNNLPPYQPHPALMKIAQAQADHLAKTGVLSRFDAAGLRPYQRAINADYSVAGDLSQGGFFAENIYGAKSSSPADVVKKWSENPADLATMLSPDWKDAGAGYAVNGGTTYYVLDAGSEVPKADPQATPIPTFTPTIPPNLVITSTPNEDGSIYHVVQKEEYLWNIALSYNMTVDDLKKLNRLTTNDIYEGQKLLIFKPKPGPTITPTVGVTPTATFGIPTSTATQPVTPTITSTATPLPTPPASLQSGQKVIGAIVLIALLAAGLGALLGRKKQE
jgi:LysM repeat protein